MNPPTNKPYKDSFIPGLIYPRIIFSRIIYPKEIFFSKEYFFPPNNLSKDYFIPIILSRLFYPPDLNPNYTEYITILNTAPKFRDLRSLLQQPDHRSDPTRAVRWQRALAAREEGGADVSEGSDGSQRRRLVLPRPNVFRGWGK